MNELHEYGKNPELQITAVQIDLETDGLAYVKWGGDQFAKRGDWLVTDGTTTYTIDDESFKATYTEVSPGRYYKTGTVWARQATVNGFIETKEGQSDYTVGDFIVYNNEDETDGYCIEADEFNAMYVRIAP